MRPHHESGAPHKTAIARTKAAVDWQKLAYRSGPPGRIGSSQMPIRRADYSGRSPPIRHRLVLRRGAVDWMRPGPANPSWPTATRRLLST